MATAKRTRKAPIANAAPAVPRAASLTARLRTLNRYREQYNPIRGLTLRVASYLFESYPRGEFGDLMWTYGAPMLGIENADADLLALIERRTGAVLEMDWQIREIEAETNESGAITWPRSYDQVLASEQLAALREAYEGIGNLYETLDHLCLATFRGFSVAEKCVNADGDIYRLEIVDHWNVVRDGLKGAWKYNPDALQTTFRGLPDANLMEPGAFLIREVRRPVNRIALLKWVRAGLSDKDWDAFIEIYGIPSGVVIMPPNVPKEDEERYLQAAQAVAEGGSGALPNGASYTANDSPRGTNPFKERLDHLSEKLILAGTGGLLTMLTAPTGLGSGVSDQHGDAFTTLAKKEARQISELFQRQIDSEILERHFPGRPVLAYFTLALNEETDTSEIVKDLQALSASGLQVDPAQIEERTGYKVTLKPEPAAYSSGGFSAALNRKLNAALRNARRATDTRPALEPPEADPDFDKFLEDSRKSLATATAEDLQPLREALTEALQGTDEELPTRLKALENKLPELARKVIGSDKSAEELYKIYSAAFASAIAPEEAAQ